MIIVNDDHTPQSGAILDGVGVGDEVRDDDDGDDVVDDDVGYHGAFGDGTFFCSPTPSLFPVRLVQQHRVKDALQQVFSNRYVVAGHFTTNTKNI